MFVREEITLDVSFAAAQARLANLVRGDSLLRASGEAYSDGITGMTRVGPLGSLRGISKLVQVYFRDLVTHPESVNLALRWEVTGAGGSLFPVMDADITLSPAGEQRTLLVLAGVYRPPLGGLGAGLDQAVLQHVATATVRRFIRRIAEGITSPATANAGDTRIAGQDELWLPRASEAQ